MANVNPTPEQVKDKVPELRKQFAEKFADEIKKGVFDDRDVKRLETEDTYARCFLRTLKSRGDIPKALEVIADAFKFRKEVGIWDLTEEMFPEDITSRKAIYYQGQDKDGHPILYFNTAENTAKGEEQTVWLKKYIAWNFEKHHRTNSEQMCVVLLDMSKASSGNVNMDITKFIITCFTTNFPAYLAYMINYEMSTLLSAFWKVISAFLSSEQKQKLLVVSKKDIGKYIPPEHQWEHMKSTK